MWSTSLALLLPALGVAYAQNANQTTIVRNRFIVELAATDSHASFYRSAKSSPALGNVVPHFNFTSDVFAGASFSTSKDVNLSTILELENVVGVWPVQLVPLGPSIPEAQGDEALAQNWTSHSATGVDRLHAQGILGEGAVVGVVDTGVYYPNEALGGGFGDGFKVIGGYDFIGDGDWPYEEATPDDDPLDELGHGTHVSGIIVGESDYFVGVAPKAKLRVYKVFGRYDGTYTDVLMAAFTLAYEDGVDIITASIGGPGGFSSDPWADLGSRIVEKGVVVTVAAGNSGAAGAFYASNGDAGKNVVAVASVENEAVAAYESHLTITSGSDLESKLIGYFPGDDAFFNAGNYTIKVLSYNQTDPAEACEPYGDDVGDLSGVVVMVRRGTCTFATKATNLEAHNASLILFYNNEGPLIQPSVGSFISTTGLISAETGAVIIEALQAGSSIVFNVPDELNIVGVDDPIYGSTPSTFSSLGPLYDLTLKPQIAAPGGKIFSTYMDGYAILSGTSMATPYIAGVAALYIGAHGGRAKHGSGFAKALSTRLVNSGYTLPYYDSTNMRKDLFAPAVQMGNGMIDAYKVLHSDTALSLDRIELNDTAHFQSTHEISVTNNGRSIVFYSFSVLPYAAFNAMNLDANRLSSSREFEPITAVPSVVFSQKYLAVFPGRSATLSVEFSPPEGLDASALPIYSGKIVVSGSNGDELGIPYFGLAADLKSVFDTTFKSSYPWSVSTLNRYNINTKPWWTFDLSIYDYPIIYVAIRYGAPEIRFDIYEPGYTEDQWEYPPSVGSNGYLGAATTYAGSENGGYFNPATMSTDDVVPFPLVEVSRNAETEWSYHEYWWLGSFANGSDVVNGRYALRFAVLRPFGDRAVASDWSVWSTPEVTVNRTTGA